MLSALISMYAVRKIIFITQKRKIFDLPDDTRKIHGVQIPSLGGIGVFTGYVVVAVFFWPREHFYMPFILASSVILFFTGVYDDLMNMRPSKKLIAQLVASFVTIYFAKISMAPFLPMFGGGEIPHWADVCLGTLFCAFFIKVFNFIDGIDGLACVLGILYLGLLGYVVMFTGHLALAGIISVLLGATLGLLYYNRAPARIDMGDTGSMFLGFSIFIFSALFVQWCAAGDISRLPAIIHEVRNVPVLVSAMLFLPVFDALRVFAVRAAKGISPLKADRAHLHYYLLDAGFTHTQSVLIMLLANVLILVVAFLLQDMDQLVTLLCITLVTSVIVFVIYRLRQQKIGEV